MLGVSWVVENDTARVGVERHLGQNIRGLPRLTVKHRQRGQICANVNGVDGSIDINHICRSQICGCRELGVACAREPQLHVERVGLSEKIQSDPAVRSDCGELELLDDAVIIDNDGGG